MSCLNLQTNKWKPEKANRFLPVSVTGTACALRCDPCKPSVLKGTVSPAAGLFSLAQGLAAQGTGSRTSWGCG